MNTQSPFSEALTLMGSDPIKKGAAFEYAIKWWLQNDPIWSGKFVPESVLLWNESSLRSGPDIGIDLTAQDTRGLNWAIQVKNWNIDRAIPKSEIDSFLSASSTANYAGRLLVTTSHEISSNARRTIEEQSIPCVVVSRSQLEESKVWGDFPSFWKNGAAVSRRVKDLMPHQAEAVLAATEYFNSGNNCGQLVMACGSGKTFTGLKITESLGSEKVLVLLPSLLLIQQTLASWREDRTEDFNFVAVCSDESVSRDTFSAGVIDLPFPVTTSASEIEASLRQPGRIVVFSTYQSSARVAEALAHMGNFEFDLIVADEAHRLAGLTGNDYGTVLNQAALPSKKRLFMTATPKVFGQKTKTAATDSGNILASMDDEEVFGKVIYNYSFARAIQDGRLTDYRLVVVGVSSSELRDQINDRVIVGMSGITSDTYTAATHVGLAKAMEKFHVNRVISFHSRVASAKTFANSHEHFLSSVDLDSSNSSKTFTATLSGADPTRKRRDTLNNLAKLPKGEKGLVTNARCLTEGVDVPNLDGIAFIEPRSSQIDIVQAVGRAIRVAPGKDLGYVVVPVFVEPTESPESQIESGPFKAVWDVVNALKAHDSQLELQLDNLRRELGSMEKLSTWPEKLILDLPAELPRDFAKKLEARLVRAASDDWFEMFGILEAFSRERGHCRVNRDESKEFKQLGTWVTKQRSKFKKDQLSVEKIARLETLTGWSWEPLDEKWLESYEVLQRYVDLKGSASPPATKDFRFEGRPLGKWVSKQRSSFKAGNLNPERAKLLSAIPGWQWSPDDANWKSSYEFVSAEAERLGHCRIPNSVLLPNSETPANRWLIAQRRNKGALDAEKINLLEKLPNWEWNPVDDRFSKGLSQLKEFIKTHGHALVPKGLPEQEGVDLFRFIQSQRAAYRSGTMKQDRIDLLESLEGWSWNLTETKWENNFRKLEQFVLEHRELPSISSKDNEEKKLASWAKHQRKLHREAKLSPDQMNSLGELPNWFWDFEDKWDEVFNDLRNYILKVGKNPDKEARGAISSLRLDSWYSLQKKNIDKLSETRRKALMGLPGFEPFGHRNQPWPDKLRTVRDFVAREERLPKYKAPDPDESKMGLWLARQRSKFDDLSRDQQSALSMLPGFEKLLSSEELWMRKLNELIQWLKRNDGILPTRKTNKDLAEWVYRQRAASARLTTNQKTLLKSLELEELDFFQES